MYCVYCHTNKLNGKKYFGITCQRTERRWRNGLGYKKGAFSNAIKKYGWDGFIHEIISDGLSEDEAKEQEVKLIREHRSSDSDYGYNITAGGDGTSGYKRPIEQREAMSRSRKGRHAGAKNPMYGKTGEQAPHYGIPISEDAKRAISYGVKKSWLDGSHDSIKKPVIGINEKSGAVVVFESASEAARATGVKDSNVCRVCRGERRTAGGYSWRYADI